MPRYKKNSGQTTIEFAFSMIIIMLMIYGMVMIFYWTGSDLIGRSKGHDAQLITAINPNYSSGSPEDGPLKQIAPYFYYPQKMNAVFGQ